MAGLTAGSQSSSGQEAAGRPYRLCNHNNATIRAFVRQGCPESCGLCPTRRRRRLNTAPSDLMQCGAEAGSILRTRLVVAQSGRPTPPTPSRCAYQMSLPYAYDISPLPPPSAQVETTKLTLALLSDFRPLSPSPSVPSHPLSLSFLGQGRARHWWRHIADRARSLCGPIRYLRRRVDTDGTLRKGEQDWDR